ncbi:MAG TPA: hypothetical protein VMV80_01980 [Anaerolineales bacterium]|nr:hypothetical protein [Anaerolineales bacterium]
MRHKYSWLITNGLIIVLMTGCNQGFTTDSYETNTPPPTINQVDGIEIFPETATPTLPTLMLEVKIADDNKPGNIYDPTLEFIVQQARGKLAQRLNIDQSQIMLIETKSILWSDASLGCPKSGMAYAQVLTPGYWVQFESSDQIYEYHTDNDDTFILCDAVLEDKYLKEGTDKKVDDGWPNQTRDNDVIIVTPTKKP